MVYRLHIPACVDAPPHRNHPPPVERPLRIHIQGPLPSIQKLLPDVKFHYTFWEEPFPQPAGLQLAELAFEAVYGRPTNADRGERLVVRDEYNAWVREPPHTMEIDYYGVTFDHGIPADDADPEVLALNLIELEETSGDYANGVEFARKYLRVSINPEEYVGKRILAVPRCCQFKRGTQDRGRINGEVIERAQRAEAARKLQLQYEEEEREEEREREKAEQEKEEGDIEAD